MNFNEKTVLIGGIGILIIGMIFILEAGDDRLHLETKKEYVQNEICTYEDVLCIPYFLKDVPYRFNDGVNGVVDLDIQFRTFDTWAVRNQINYTIILEADKPNVFSEVYFLNLQPTEDITKINGTTIRSVIQEYNSTGSLFVLEQKTPVHYVAEGNWFSPIEQDVQIYGILVHDTYATAIPPSQPLLTIGSHLQKLQADTNKELIQQVKESRITNDRLLGLTIILVSFVPLGIVLERILHKEDRSWNDDYKIYQ